MVASAYSQHVQVGPTSQDDGWVRPGDSARDGVVRQGKRVTAISRWQRESPNTRGLARRADARIAVADHEQSAGRCRKRLVSREVGLRCRADERGRVIGIELRVEPLP